MLWLRRGVDITKDLKKHTGAKLKDFRDYLNKEVRRPQQCRRRPGQLWHWGNCDSQLMLGLVYFLG